jgi:hypothetical protein
MAATRGTRRGNGAGCPDSKGTGWGGPAKGAGSSAPSFSDSLEHRIDGAVTADPDVRAWAEIKAMSREQQAEDLNDVILRIAHYGDRENDRLTAAFGFQDRILGKTVQRNLNINTDATPLSGVDRPPPETREAWIARRKRERGEALMGSPVGSAD